MYKKLLTYNILFTLFTVFSCHYGAPPPSPSLSVAERFSTDVSELTAEVTAMMKWEQRPAALGLGGFFYSNTKMSSDFAYHLSTEIEKTVTDMPGFILVDREHQHEILNELGFQVSDLVDPGTAKNIGRIKGLDALLTGNYSVWEGQVQMKLSLIRIEDAQMVVATRAMGSVPAGVPVLPPDYEVQRQRIDNRVEGWLADESGAVTSDFRVTIEPERMEAYREGDELKLYVKAEVDCYVEIYNVSQDGATNLIFPNGYWLKTHSPEDAFIRAGVRTPIPSDPSFKLSISPPYGIETLKVIASTRPFSSRDSSFYRSRGAFPGMGDIDDEKTLESLKYRARSVIATPGSPGEEAKVAESYCTILTKPN